MLTIALPEVAGKNQTQSVIAGESGSKLVVREEKMEPNGSHNLLMEHIGGRRRKQELVGSHGRYSITLAIADSGDQ